MHTNTTSPVGAVSAHLDPRDLPDTLESLSLSLDDVVSVERVFSSRGLSDRRIIVRTRDHAALRVYNLDR